MTIVGFDEVVSHLGEFVRIRLKEDISEFTRYEEIEASNGMTAIIQEINTGQRIMKIMPTNSTYVTINETITGQTSDETATVMGSEGTAIETYEKRANNFVEDYTGKLFGSTESRTEKFTTATEGTVYWVSKRPLVSVDTVVLDDVTLTENEHYWVDLEIGKIDFHDTIMSHSLEPDNLQITFTHGEETVPEVVKQAAILYITHFWQKRNFNSTMKGASSMSFGGRSVGWTTDMKFDEVMKEIKQILKPLTKVRFDSIWTSGARIAGYRRNYI